jgi:Protein of unknown function (DUF3137)
MASMIDIPDSDTLMAGGLSDWLATKQGEREKASAQIQRIWTWAGIIGVILVFAIIFYWGVVQPIFFIGTIGVTGVLWWTGKIRKAVVDGLKQEMNGALAGALGVGYTVTAVSGDEFELSNQFDILPSYDDVYLQDQWQGKIGDTDFLLYEAKLTEQQGSGKSRRTVTTFEGIILRFQFARPFLSTTLVRREGFKFTLFGDDKNFDGQVLDRVKMVDPRFEDAFDVYSSDPVESRYLVHPAYCERLLELERDFYGSKLAALFRHGELIVTVNAENMFESATLDPTQDRELLGRTITQFASMARLIELLNERPRE